MKKKRNISRTKFKIYKMKNSYQSNQLKKKKSTCKIKFAICKAKNSNKNSKSSKMTKTKLNTRLNFPTCKMRIYYLSKKLYLVMKKKKNFNTK